jgi:hypothetical protein
MSPPGRTVGDRGRQVVQGGITSNKHARCNMGNRGFIP